MAGDWPRLTIADCASNEPYSTQIGPFGEKLKAHNYLPLGSPVLRGTNVNPDGRFHDDDFVFIDPDWAATEFNKFVCEAGDIILCHKGTLGKIGIVPEHSRFHKYIMGNSMMKVRCNRSKLEPLFLYYWLCSAEGQHYLFSRVSQVGVPQIQRPLSTLREAELPVPPLETQKLIAHILGTLDDKIELNRRTNETLEAMARAIFKSWFVDFDPVKAKAAGQKPFGMDEETDAMFPSEFEDSELGPIPKGWRVGSFSKIATLRRDSFNPEKSNLNFPYIGLEHLPRKSIDLSEWGSSADVQSQKLFFKKYDVLFGKLRPYFHKVGLAQVDGICSTDIVVFDGSEPFRRSYTLFVASSDAFIDFATGHSGGTRMPRISAGDLMNYSCVVPPKNIVLHFNGKVQPLLELILLNASLTKTLVQTRDLLLPKLLSGELDLTEFEEKSGFLNEQN